MRLHVRARVFELIDEEPQIPDPEPDAVDCQKHDTGQCRALEHVDFSYTPEKKLIEDFNLDVKPGQTRSNCRTDRLRQDNADQSADAFLRCRYSGSIRIVGTDIRAYDSARALRSDFGMVLQDTWLRQRNASGTTSDGKSGRNG